MPPQTIWAPTNGKGEYTSSSQDDIVDPSGVFLVDPSANNVVSTAVTFTQLASTTWLTNDAI